MSFYILVMLVPILQEFIYLFAVVLIFFEVIFFPFRILNRKTRKRKGLDATWRILLFKYKNYALFFKIARVILSFP